MLTGKTQSGFEYAVDESVADDMELLENLCLLDGGEMSVLPTILTQLLGAGQKKALYDFLRGENGRVSSKKVVMELRSIFDDIGVQDSDLKNS